VTAPANFSMVEVTAPANFFAIAHGDGNDLEVILIPGHLPIPTRSIRAGQTLATRITAGRGLAISTIRPSVDPGPGLDCADQFASVLRK
jgi:hypothetical protein